MKNIIECIPGAATPMNTLGMGTVEPCGTDPIPFRRFKRKKSRKRRMKHLKDIINEKLKVTVNNINSNILERIWDVADFKSFYRFFKFTDSFGSYAYTNATDYKITEYCFGYDVIQDGNYNGEFEGLGDIIKSIKTLRPVRFDNSTYQDVFGDIDGTGHIDAFIYTSTSNSRSCCFVIETFTEGLCFYNVFSLDKNLVDEIIDYLLDDLTPIDAYSLKEQTTVELDFLK